MVVLVLVAVGRVTGWRRRIFAVASVVCIKTAVDAAAAAAAVCRHCRRHSHLVGCCCLECLSVSVGTGISPAVETRGCISENTGGSSSSSSTGREKAFSHGDEECFQYEKIGTVMPAAAIEGEVVVRGLKAPTTPFDDDDGKKGGCGCVLQSSWRIGERVEWERFLSFAEGFTKNDGRLRMMYFHDD